MEGACCHSGCDFIEVYLLATAAATSKDDNKGHCSKGSSSSGVSGVSQELQWIDQSSMLSSCRDADLYRHDADLFREGQWLNSSCINYSLRLMEQQQHESDATTAVLLQDKVLVMDPTVVHFLRAHCEDDEDFEQLAMDTGMREKIWVLAPINNNDSPIDTSSCSHWSLLLIQCDRGECYHFDSSNKLNSKAAIITSKHFAKLLGKKSMQCTDVASTPQQPNGYDCGIFVILFAQAILACLVREGQFCKTIHDIENEIKKSIPNGRTASNAYRLMMCNMFK